MAQAKAAGVHPSTVYRREQKLQRELLPAPPLLKRAIDSSGPGSLYVRLAERDAWLEDAGEDHPERQRIIDECYRLRELMARKIDPKWIAFRIPQKDLAKVPRWWRD